MEDGDVIVCGAGAAGLAAAISAARHGAQVLLVEKSSAVGGTVAKVLIHTLAGLYDSAGELLNDGLPRELVERLILQDPLTRRRKMGRSWVLNVCPQVYRQTVQTWLETEPRIDVVRGARLTDVVRSDRRIEEVELLSPKGCWRVRPAGVVDATGSAEVIRLIDDSLVVDDDSRAAGGLIFRVRGVEKGALDFPKGLGIVRALRSAAAAGELPPACAHAWVDSGVNPDDAFIKLMLATNCGPQATTLPQAIVKFLRTLPGFAAIEVTETGAIGVRDGGRIRGRYTLSGDDVRQGRRFFDGVCRCAWPIEYWDCDKGVALEYLPAGAYYEIPMRSLQLDGLDNLWAAGKCLSADREAHASARVVGSCWAMGAAVGAAAASGRWPREQQRNETELLSAISRDCAAAAR